MAKSKSGRRRDWRVVESYNDRGSTGGVNDDNPLILQQSDEAMQNYAMKDLDVHDILSTYYGNDRSALASELAGTSDKRSAAYKRAYHNISRWEGRGKERRTPSEASRKQLSSSMMKHMRNHPPSNASISVTGTFRVSKTRYHDSLKLGGHSTKIDVGKLIDNIQSGDIQGAWDTIFEDYVPGMSVERLDSLEIRFY